MTNKNDDNEEEKTVIVFSGTTWEASMIQNLLTNIGIESFLSNNVMANYCYTPTLVDNVRVNILESNYKMAKQIVDEYYENMKNEK